MKCGRENCPSLGPERTHLSDEGAVGREGLDAVVALVGDEDRAVGTDGDVDAVVVRIGEVELALAGALPSPGADDRAGRGVDDGHRRLHVQRVDEPVRPDVEGQQLVWSLVVDGSRVRTTVNGSVGSGAGLDAAPSGPEVVGPMASFRRWLGVRGDRRPSHRS